jgi:YidC/Oxa1 family membrane protein insertase
VDIISASLDVTYRLVESLSTVLAPIVGSTASAASIVALTLVIRAAFIPLGIAQVRADIARRRLAPLLAALQRRWGKNPERLARETRELYAREKVSPFAGILPVLAQAPVLSVVYGVFSHGQIAGHSNRLLGDTLAGVPLGGSLAGALQHPAGAAVYAVVLGVLLAVALINRRQGLRLAATTPNGAMGALTWLPLISVVFAAIVPLAAGLYLAVSSAWGLAERTVTRRILVGRAPTPAG